jgi:hypothetical protein
MASYFISAHGDWARENAYTLVPRGTTIYFFSPHATLLHKLYSDFLMDILCNPNCKIKDEEMIQNQAVEIIGAGERVRNYILTGTDRDFRDPTGVYRTGVAPAEGLFSRLLNGSKKTLRDVVGGIKGEGSIGNHIYWGACRKTFEKLPATRFTGLAGTSDSENIKGKKDGPFAGKTTWAAQVDEGPDTMFLLREVVVKDSTGKPIRVNGEKVWREEPDWSRLRTLKARLRAGGKLIEEEPIQITRTNRPWTRPAR